MTSKAQYNPLTFQVTLTVLALAAFSLAMVIGFGFFATLKADRDSLEKQKIFVTNGIADEIAAVVRQQQSVTVWDDSIINAKAGNQTWMAENLGEWMYAYYGHDRVYVLDDAGRPDPCHARRQDRRSERLRRGPPRNRAVGRAAARPDRRCREIRRIRPHWSSAI